MLPVEVEVKNENPLLKIEVPPGDPVEKKLGI
jgi:hypothetical protein